jgi:hypothetical protein
VAEPVTPPWITRDGLSVTGSRPGGEVPAAFAPVPALLGRRNWRRGACFPDRNLFPPNFCPPNARISTESSLQKAS